MHSYLRSIGFSELAENTELEALNRSIIKNAYMKKAVSRGNGNLAVEYAREFAPCLGMMVKGEEDHQGRFHYDHGFPYYKSSTISCCEELFIHKRVETDAYTAMLDDFRLGVSLIFYVQNALDYESYNQLHKEKMTQSVSLSGLSLGGKIILPVFDSEREKSKIEQNLKKKGELLAEAKNGDQDAMESLTFEELDTYASVAGRIQNEDLFSIVNNSFYPYGSESDVYSILGTITAVNQVVNSETEEKVWILSVECNQLPLDVCINEQDLLGEPAIGRRFRGNIWLQGYIDFI